MFNSNHLLVLGITSVSMNGVTNKSGKGAYDYDLGMTTIYLRSNFTLQGKKDKSCSVEQSPGTFVER